MYTRARGFIASSTYTLINSFPLILNEVFATDYELQEDRLMELLRRYRERFLATVDHVRSV